MMKKKPVTNSNKVAVTFEVPSDVVANPVYLVGDFNNWDQGSTPLKRSKDGKWSTTVRLLPGTYRFRYFAEGGTWFNDAAADGYEPSGFGADNSVLVVG